MFQKALNQVILFFKITIDKGKFDVDKDFYDGRLIPNTHFLDDGDTRPSQSRGRVEVLERTVSEYDLLCNIKCHLFGCFCKTPFEMSYVSWNSSVG